MVYMGIYNANDFSVSFIQPAELVAEYKIMDEYTSPQKITTESVSLGYFAN